MNQQEQNQAVDCFLLAGKLLMQYGAETLRVEDTMLRMAASQGYKNAETFVTPTGILFSLDHDCPTKITRVGRRSTDLEKIARINALSRRLAANEITLEKVYKRLKFIEFKNFSMRYPWQMFFAAISSGCFVILFDGTFFDMPAAAVAGGLGYGTFLLFNKITNVKIFAEFVAAFFIGLIAILAVAFGLGLEENKIIIGAVMPLVPGVAIANAVKDLMAGHFVSGTAKGVEGCLTALSVGSGIAVALFI